MSPEDRDALAAELAIGLLEGEARLEAMQLRLSDPDFAASVDAWSRRLEPLTEAFSPHPAPALWPAIERRLGVVDGDRIRRSLRRWRVGAIGSAALAASLAAVLLLRPVAPPTQIVRPSEPAAIAQLGGNDAAAVLAARYDPAVGVMRIRAVQMPSSNLAPELWVIPADGVPRSLGLIAASGTSKVEISVSYRDLLRDGVTLAITLEPRDGAPHRAPSSAPIAAGKIATI